MKDLRKCAWLLALAFVLSCGLQAAEQAEPADAAKKPAEAKKAPPAGLETNLKQFSYMMGVNVGMQMKRQGLDLDMKALARGLGDSIGEGELAFTPEELNNIAQTFFMKKQQDMQAKALENGKKEEAFLAENGKKENVKTTASGLQYQVMTEGEGAQPGAKDTVTVHYRGTLLSGKEFDSSYKRKEPTAFELGQVIPGWQEGIALMKVGGTYRFWIPSKLGYGPRGSGPEIGPNEVLIFDVELLNTKAPGILNPVKK